MTCLFYTQDNDSAVLSLEEIKACLEEVETEKVGNTESITCKKWYSVHHSEAKILKIGKLKLPVKQNYGYTYSVGEKSCERKDVAALLSCVPLPS